MPDPATQAYLARYLSHPEEPARKKKRKAKTQPAEQGLVIQDENPWPVPETENEEEDTGDALVRLGPAEGKKPAFKRAFASDTQTGSSDTPCSAASAPSATSDAPAAPTAPARPQAGLMTKEDIRRQREERLARAAAAKAEAAAELQPVNAKEQETVYRDATGRKIDLAAEAAERAEAERVQKAKEAERAKWGRGHVQLEEEKRRQRELEEIKDEGVARYATDEKMNAQLRAVVRADDPALPFLSTKQETGPRMPKYTGPTPPPNRFGIAPGYRWDGVDRSNGFERQYFARINERKRRDQVAQAWRQEDM